LERFKSLTDSIKAQELAIEAYRETREQLKYNADVFEAELYLAERQKVVKTTEANLEALITTNQDLQAKRVAVIEKDNQYKKALIDLNYLQNNLRATELEIRL